MLLRTIKAVAIVVTLFAGFEVQGQTPGLGVWNVVNAKYDFNKRWNGFFEAQARSQKFLYDYFYHELKVAAGYRIAAKANLLVGIGQYVTYDYEGNFKSPVHSHELRIWQQLNLNQDVGLVKIEHRYRIEQRYFSTGYRNRFRYRFNATLPIPHTNLFLNSFEEVFITNEKPFFERNRLYGSAGYKVSPLFSFQLGYMSQYDYNKNVNPYTKNFLQTSFLFDLNTLKKDAQKQHS